MVTFAVLTWRSQFSGNFYCQYLLGFPHGLVRSLRKTPPNSGLEGKGLAASVCWRDKGEK